MSSKPSGSLEHFGPDWNRHPVPTFAGMFDTHIETGEDYPALTLAEIFSMEPTAADKGAGPAFIPSSYRDYDARSHEAQRERGSFVALTGDVDSGNHTLKDLEALLDPFCDEAARLIYSSPHARPGDMRWRIVIPLHAAIPFEEWYDAQLAFFAYMETHGVTMDYALARAGQPVYLPNVPEFHAKTGEPLRQDGKALFFERSHSPLTAQGLPLTDGLIKSGVAEILRKRAADERERERIRAEAEQRRANAPKNEGEPIIADFNRSNSLETLLELYGFQRSPRNGDDWRSPHQTSESYATRVIDGKWVSLSASDVGARMGAQHRSGCYGDAYDLFVHFEHGGDHKAAFRTLYQERRAASSHAPAEAPPPLPSDDPGWSEEDVEAAPEAVEAFDEPDIPAVPRLPFFWFRDAEPNLDASDFVEGLLTTAAMSVVYGPSNCGKTFFIVDLALHVAWGREWRGKAIDRGAVVYLSLEGAQGIRNRLSAFRRHHGLDNEALPFVAMPQPVNLLNDDADVNAVIQLVQHVAAETGLRVAMVIVDTLSRAMAGGNENSPEDMTAIVGNCDRIRNETGAHVCIVHHSGKDEAKGARGHSSLRAATDTEIEIKRDPEMTISGVRVSKQRDLEADEPFAFALHKIELGTNRRGKAVTSCIVVEAEKSVALSRDPNKLSEKENQALDCLARCIEAAGFEDRNIDVTGDVTVVTQDHWKSALSAAGVTDRNNGDTARVQFNRIRKALVNKRKISAKDNLVWLA